MKLFKNNQSGRSLLSKCGVDEQIFLSDVYKKRTQSKKYQSDAPQFGRSMVEMLGVLAIIGVLSVGGIAGYSKAMFKHKMNQTLDALSHAFNRIVELDGLNTYALEIRTEDIIKYGIMPDCETKDVGCQLPLKNVQLDINLWSNSYDGTDWALGGRVDVLISGNDRTRLETCNAILNSGIHEIYPDNWWKPISPNPNDLPSIYVSNMTSEIVYTKYPTPNNHEYNTITPARIADACQHCIAENPEIDLGYCVIRFQIRCNCA